MRKNLFLKVNNLFLGQFKDVLKHDGFLRYFKNTGWMFFGHTFNIISMVINILVARYLGPDNFGMLSYALAFVGVFGFISNFGIGGVLVRDLVNNPERRDELLGTGFAMTVFGGLMAFFLSVFSSFVFIQEDLMRKLIIIFSLTFLFSSSSVIVNYFQATVEAKKNAKAQIISTVISSIVKVVLIYLGKNVVWIMWVYVLDYVSMCVAHVYNYQRSGLKIKLWSFDKRILKNFLSITWLIMLSTASAYIYAKIDQIMIGYYLGSISVGFYAAAIRLVEVWYFIPAIICSSLFPAIINAKKTGGIRYVQRLNRLYIFLVSLAVLIAVPSTFLAPIIVKVLFGNQYLLSISILQIYIWSCVGLFLMYGINQYLLSENRVQMLFVINFFSMLVNVVLNMFFIPHFGLNGAAWATLISYSVGPAYLFMFDKFFKSNSLQQ